MSDKTSIIPREFMELAVEVMRNSIQESRTDKSSPLVGAVLVRLDGSFETAYRGEFSEGDHAEFTLLERKLLSENLAGTSIFATLEPCAPGARSATKTSCAERIVNRRIKNVWVGIEDPDPLVDRKGIQFLLDNGVEVEMFDSDLQSTIREINTAFISGAEKRATEVSRVPIQNPSVMEAAVPHTLFDDLDKSQIEKFIDTAKYNITYGEPEFIRVFSSLGLLVEQDEKIIPTGAGLLLFGNNPQIVFPHALIRAVYKTAGRKEDIISFEGSLVKQIKDCYEWLCKVINRQVDRTEPERKIEYDYPMDVIRESLINAVTHRRYDIKGAAVYIEVNDDSIIIKSPGEPVSPITLEQLRSFKVPSLSRNPLIMFVCEKLDITEQRGFGFDTIRKLQSEYDRPLPDITFDGVNLCFMFPRRYGITRRANDNISEFAMGESEQRGLDFIRTREKTTRREYEEFLKVSDRTAKRHLSRFLELGLIEISNGGRNSYYKPIVHGE